MSKCAMNKYELAVLDRVVEECENDLSKIPDALTRVLRTLRGDSAHRGYMRRLLAPVAEKRIRMAIEKERALTETTEPAASESGARELCGESPCAGISPMPTLLAEGTVFSDDDRKALIEESIRAQRRGALLEEEGDVVPDPNSKEQQINIKPSSGKAA